MTDNRLRAPARLRWVGALAFAWLAAVGFSQTDTVYSVSLQRLTVTTTVDIGAGPTAHAFYVTDGGQWLGEVGTVPWRAAVAQAVDTTAARVRLVFVHNVDAATGATTREADFFRNPAYVRYFRDELLGGADPTYGRTLVGISFGGLNAAYFSTQAPQLFDGYALLSPITYPRPAVREDVAFAKTRPASVLLTTGRHDAERYVEVLAGLYRGRGWPTETLSTDGAHDFANWAGRLVWVVAWAMG